MWRILTIRPFTDENTRVALAAMVSYLEMNRLTWNCSEVEETAMVLRAFARKMKKGEWVAWVVGNLGMGGRRATQVGVWRGTRVGERDTPWAART